MNSHLWRVHAHYSPQLVERWTCVRSPLLSHTPPPQEKNRWFKRSHTARSLTWSRWRLPVDFMAPRMELVHFIFIFYFVRLPLCNKYSNYIVTFISIHSVIICVVFFGAYMRCTRLCPLNPGVTIWSKILGLSWKNEGQVEWQVLLIYTIPLKPLLKKGMMNALACTYLSSCLLFWMIKDTFYFYGYCYKN
jgi:hypothetical protein